MKKKQTAAPSSQLTLSHAPKCARCGTERAMRRNSAAGGVFIARQG